MSIDVASLPAWKLALLERRRRGQMDSDGVGSKSGGCETLGNIPPWKQEILFRKKQKRYSTGTTYESLDGENRRSLSEILLSPEDGGRSKGVESWHGLLSPVGDARYYADLKSSLRNSTDDQASDSERVDIPVEEGRLPPVHRNPILLLDLEKRQHSGFSVGLSSPSEVDSQRKSGLPSKSSKLRAECLNDNEHIEGSVADSQDDVLREEEVTYGKGFVSRLLQRFSYMSGKEDQLMPQPPFRSLLRGQSSEDFTRHCYYADVRSKKKKTAERKKASSLDDLLKESTSEQYVVENGSTTDRRDEMLGHEGRAEVGIVLNAKSIFEGLATSPTSTTKPPLLDQRSTSATKAQDIILAHHPPAIIGPKPVYPGPATSLQSVEHDPTVFLVAQNCREDRKLAESTAEETNSAESAITDDRVSGIHKSTNDYENTSSISKFQNSCCSDVSTDVRGVSNDHTNHVHISAHIEERSTIKEDPVQGSFISIQAQRHLKRSEEGNTKTLDSETEKSLGSVESNTKVNEPEIVHNANTQETGTENAGKLELVSGSVKKISEPENAKRHEPVLGNAKPHETVACNATIPIESAPKKTAPSRPGLLLIRPASNLTTTRSDHMQMTKYNDITKGEFAPAKRPIHKSGVSVDDEESDSDEVDGCAGYHSKNLRVRYEFEGSGVIIGGRSLLAKTKQGSQLKLRFDDSATSTYDYPSEQCLIDSMPPEPGDADYPTIRGEQNGKTLPAHAVQDHSRVHSGPVSEASSSTGKVTRDSSTTSC